MSDDDRALHTPAYWSISARDASSWTRLFWLKRGVAADRGVVGKRRDGRRLRVGARVPQQPVDPVAERDRVRVQQDDVLAPAQVEGPVHRADEAEVPRILRVPEQAPRREVAQRPVQLGIRPAIVDDQDGEPGLLRRVQRRVDGAQGLVETLVDGDDDDDVAPFDVGGGRDRIPFPVARRRCRRPQGGAERIRLEPEFAALRDVVVQRVGLASDHIPVGVEIELAPEEFGRIAALLPSVQSIVPQRIDAGIPHIVILREIEVRVEVVPDRLEDEVQSDRRLVLRALRRR
ncbi:MAG: hypothetical protein PGN34_17360 [Methylobacterium frigidaeris]